MRTERHRTVVVGLGRLGSALAAQLRRAGWPVRVRTRSPSGRRQASRLGLHEATEQDLLRSELCLLAVPDAAVGAVAGAVAPLLGASTGLVHCAGALTLEVLAAVAGGRPVGSFHPLVNVTGPRTVLAGHAVAVATRSRALAPRLGALARALELTPVQVAEAGRAAYHAGASLAASGLVAHLDATVEAWRAAGVTERDALAALIPLMRSALDGVEEHGLVAALTGPVVRGDAEVVQAHLRALPKDVVPLYRQLAARVLDRMADRLSRPTVLRLSALLGPRRSK